MKRKNEKLEVVVRSQQDLAMLYYDNSDLKVLLKISYATIYRWRKKNLLKFCKIGSKYYYPKIYIDQMMYIRNL